MTAFVKKPMTVSAFLAALAFILPVSGPLCATAPLVNVLAPVTVLGPVTDEVSSPIRIAGDRFGNFYLTDPRGKGVLKFNSSGRLVATFPYKAPQGIAVTQAGDLIVGQDTFVAVLDNTGKEKFRLGKGDGQFKMANGIALDASGFIYVVDSLDDCVQAFNAAGSPVNIGNAASGKPANSFGTSGILPGQFSLPTGITFDKSSNQLAVVDTLNGRLQFFNTSGAYQKSIGSAGSGPLRFTSPMSVAFEYSKDAKATLMRMYVVDSFQSNVQVIDASGTWLGYIGSYGTANGRLFVPSDAVFDSFGNRLLVANGFGNLTVYGIDGGSTPIADTTPPALTITPPPTVTSSSSLVIGGTVEAGATISITTSTAAAAGPVTFPTPATWSATITGLVSGANEITVTARDQAANSSQQKATVTLDLLATKLTINPVTALTNTASQTISGTMDAGATITITTNTTVIAGPVSNPTPTTWSSTISGLAHGANTVTVIASKAGSDNAVTSVIITLDTTPPSLTVSSLSNNSTSSSSVLNVTGLTDPAIAAVMVNGQPVNTVDGIFSTALLLNDGANIVSVVATDQPGNTTADTRTITFDPTSPAVTITSPADGANVNTPTMTVSGTSPANSTTLVKVNGITQTTLNGASWSTTVVLNQLVGIYTIEAVSTGNQSGNAAGTTKSTVFLNDLTKPALAVISPNHDRATNDPNLPVTGTANAASVTTVINGVPVPVSFQAQNGTFAITPEFATEDRYTLAVTAVDPLGNSVTTFRTLFYHISAPAFSVTLQTPISISGTGDSGAVVTVKDKTGAVVATTIVTNGVWSVNLSGSEAGPLNISATDAAGNNTRNGNITGSGGKPNIVDAIKAMRIAMGSDTAAVGELLRGDVAPLVNGVPLPDGKIDTGDVLIILRKVVGLINF